MKRFVVAVHVIVESDPGHWWMSNDTENWSHQRVIQAPDEDTAKALVVADVHRYDYWQKTITNAGQRGTVIQVTVISTNAIEV